MKLFIHFKYILFFTTLLLLSCNSTNNSNLYFTKGILDISNVNLNDYGLIRLNGNVEFYWKKLLKPNDFKKEHMPRPDAYINIPGVWNDFIINDTAINKNGFATYRFIIKVNKDDRYGIKIKEFDCSYKIWVNNVLLDSVGVVGINSQSSVPSWERKEVYFNSKNKHIEVIIQIANFHHRLGGPEDVMLFGYDRDIYRYKLFQLSRDVFILGVLLIVSIFHLFIYFFRKKEKSVLFFSLLSIMMIIRLITTSEKILISLFPLIDWSMAVRFEYSSYTLLLPLFMSFIFTYYPKDFSKKVVIIISSVAALFTLFYFVTPVNIFSYTPLYYQIFIIICGIYVLFKLIKVQINKRDNALIFLSGYIFFILILTNDILYYNKIISTSFLMPYGLFVMFLSQAYAISRRLFNAYNEVEKLTVKLDNYNRELEQIIKDRTAEIYAQKDEIEIQANVLFKINDELINLVNFKESMTGMVVHDMKNLLNNIIYLTEKNKKISDTELFNSMDAVNQSARQLLILVLNILDIQKFEEAKMELDLQMTNVNTIINLAKNEVTPSLLKKNILINNICPKELKLNIDGDIIKRVFINILLNSIKYSDINSEIIINCKQEKKNIKFFVIDKGKGIPQKIASTVFEKFKTIDMVKENADKMKSTGLGLNFCKLAIEAHKGKIGIKSQVNEGTEIWFTIPTDENKEMYTVKNEIVEQKSQQNTLTSQDIIELKPYCEKLIEIKYYEVSTIKEIIGNLREYNSDGIKKWLNIIEKAVYYGIENKYIEQINLILNK